MVFSFAKGIPENIRQAALKMENKIEDRLESEVKSIRTVLKVFFILILINTILLLYLSLRK